MSEETAAFSAIITAFGERVGEVANRGQGGSNEYVFKNRENQNKFLETAKVFYPGAEGEDSFVDELIVRNEMKNDLLRKTRKAFPNVTFPIIALFRTKPHYVSKDYFYFLEEEFARFKTLDGVRQEIVKAKPDEYVIYISETLSFEGERHEPGADVIERIDREELAREIEQTRRRTTWTNPTALEKCEFLVSENEDNSVRITDSETGREIEIDRFAFNNGRRILIGLFGAGIEENREPSAVASEVGVIEESPAAAVAPTVDGYDTSGGFDPRDAGQ